MPSLRSTLKNPSLPRLGRGSVAVWVALAILIAVSPIVASGSLGKSAILSMLPFAAVLMIAAIGQTLVIQQGGLDFSVPGSISLGAVILTHHAQQQGGRVITGIFFAVVVCSAAGLVSGLLVSRAAIPPLIATLGVNALLTGAAVEASHQSVVPAPANLTRFMLDKTAGIPNTFLIAVGLVAVVAVVMRRTVFGRQFEFTGMSPPAGRAAGLAVSRLQVAGYTLAGAMYAVAGIVLAGYLGNPDINAGDPYLLSTVAAVVLGGASLAGGRASVVATAAGAVFLTQLDQVVLSSGAQLWAQYLIQGAVIGLGMGLRALPRIGRSRGAGSPPSRTAPTKELSEPPLAV